MYRKLGVSSRAEAIAAANAEKDAAHSDSPRVNEGHELEFTHFASTSVREACACEHASYLTVRVREDGAARQRSP
jgi:hypothetical protein